MVTNLVTCLSDTVPVVCSQGDSVCLILVGRSIKSLVALDKLLFLDCLRFVLSGFKANYEIDILSFLSYIPAPCYWMPSFFVSYALLQNLSAVVLWHAGGSFRVLPATLVIEVGLNQGVLWVCEVKVGRTFERIEGGGQKFVLRTFDSK